MRPRVLPFILGLAALLGGLLALLHGAGVVTDQAARLLVPILLIFLGAAGLAVSRARFIQPPKGK